MGAKQIGPRYRPGSRLQAVLESCLKPVRAPVQVLVVNVDYMKLWIVDGMSASVHPCGPENARSLRTKPARKDAISAYDSGAIIVRCHLFW